MPVKQDSSFRSTVLIIIATIVAMIFFQFNSNSYCLTHHSWQTAPWQLWTAHLVHINVPHFLLNVAGLFTLLLFFRTYLFPALVLTLLFIAPLISLPMMTRLVAGGCYYGFSGLLHTLYIGLAIVALFNLKERGWGAVILALFVAKLTLEAVGISISENLLPVRVAYEMHQFGSIGGVVLGILLIFYQKQVTFDGIYPENQ